MTSPATREAGLPHARSGAAGPVRHRMFAFTRCPRGNGALAAALAGWVFAGWVFAGWPGAARAQNFQSYFPSGTAGYDQQLGVTVLSRLHPLYETPGTNIGAFVIVPTLAESMVYNSSLNGSSNSGQWGSSTSGSVSAGSDWTRNRLDASLGFTHQQYFGQNGPEYTDWNVGLAGGYTVADSMLDAGYSHSSYHQLGISIGTIRSSTPVLDQTDTAQADYTFNLNRLAITPDISATSYSFGTSTTGGVALNQKFLDRNVLAGGVTGRFSMNDEGGLLAVLRGINSTYANPQPGQPSQNANSMVLLGGIDYQATGVWRYRLLLGLEVRQFQATQFATQTAPVIEASAIWTPTDLTTVTGTLSREIEDPESAGTSGYVLTQANLVVDHELLRNVFLQGRGGIELAQYLQTGLGQTGIGQIGVGQTGGETQTNLTAGSGVTWLINRNLRLSFDYGFTKLTGSGHSSITSEINPTTTSTAGFTQNVATLTLRLAL